MQYIKVSFKNGAREYKTCFIDMPLYLIRCSPLRRIVIIKGSEFANTYIKKPKIFYSSGMFCEDCFIPIFIKFYFNLYLLMHHRLSYTSTCAK